MYRSSDRKYLLYFYILFLQIGYFSTQGREELLGCDQSIPWSTKGFEQLSVKELETVSICAYSSHITGKR